MPASDFNDFYAQACEALDLRPVALVKDDRGERAFTISWRGADVSFTERTIGMDERVSIAVRFGAPPADKALDILRHLMGTSYQMMSEGASFVMSPRTGVIYLHSQTSLSGFHVPGLRSMLDEFAGQLERWNTDYFLGARRQAHRAELNASLFA
ncbi:MAG: hypothetical protein V4669_21100 [Pseudomonadota bacterium]